MEAQQYRRPCLPDRVCVGGGGAVCRSEGDVVMGCVE